jgi:hypothetical protein
MLPCRSFQSQTQPGPFTGARKCTIARPRGMRQNVLLYPPYYARSWGLREPSSLAFEGRGSTDEALIENMKSARSSHLNAVTADGALRAPTYTQGLFRPSTHAFNRTSNTLA